MRSANWLCTGDVTVPSRNGATTNSIIAYEENERSRGKKTVVPRLTQAGAHQFGQSQLRSPVLAHRSCAAFPGFKPPEMLSRCSMDLSSPGNRRRNVQGGPDRIPSVGSSNRATQH